jgi:hypothetical protein
MFCCLLRYGCTVGEVKPQGSAKAACPNNEQSSKGNMSYSGECCYERKEQKT